MTGLKSEIMSYIYMLNYKNVSRVALHRVREFNTNCHWTGYLFMGYMTTKGINHLFKMGEQHFLTGRAGWQGEAVTQKYLPNTFSPMVPFLSPLGLLGNTFATFSLRNKKVMAKTHY